MKKKTTMAAKNSKIPSLLERIAKRHRNRAKTAQAMLSKAVAVEDKAKGWQQEISSMLRYQVVAMLFVVATMQTNVTRFQKLANWKGLSNGDLETLEVQDTVLKEIMEDVQSILILVEEDIDVVLSETRLVDAAATVLDEALQDMALLSDEEIRALQAGGDFAGLCLYIKSHSPMSIVSALMQAQGNKPGEVIRILSEFKGNWNDA